jgi:hypothetical protein
LKLNGTHELLVYGNGVNILGGSVHTTKTNEEALVVASKKTGLEVIADKTKHTVMSRDQDAGRSHSVKINNNSFENLEEFKYFYSQRNFEQIEGRECLLSFGAESFVFQFAIHKFKD